MFCYCCSCSWMCSVLFFFFFSSRRRHTRCALVTGVQTCALPIYAARQMLLRDVNNLTALGQVVDALRGRHRRVIGMVSIPGDRRDSDIIDMGGIAEIGRASCRERVCTYV